MQENNDVEDRKALILFATRLVELAKFEEIHYRADATGQTFRLETADVSEEGLVVHLVEVGRVVIHKPSITAECFARPESKDGQIVPHWLGGPE